MFSLIVFKEAAWSISMVIQFQFLTTTMEIDLLPKYPRKYKHVPTSSKFASKKYSLLSWKSTGRPSELQDDICNCLVDISTCLSQHVQNCTFSLISLIADPIFFISVSHFSMYPGAEDKSLQTVLYTSLSL